MSDEFHDWLDQCPVQWFRGEVTDDHVTYSFETPNEDEGEDEQKTRLGEHPGPDQPLALAGGPGPELQATSGKLQASSSKLDKTTLQRYSIL